MTRRGFTLLEVALVIGILTTLLFLTLIVATGSIGRSALRTTENILVQSIRRAQTLAQNAVQDKNWGVYICPGVSPLAECTAGGQTATPSIVLFKRTSPATNFGTFDAANDQIFEINPNVAFGGQLFTDLKAGTVGLRFSKITGTPTPAPATAIAGTITFSFQGESRSIVMNGKGVVEH